jgi:hypothetical protein
MHIGSPIAASVLAALLLLLPAAPARSRPRVLPPPLELRERQGGFTWPEALSIGLVGSREEDAFAAEVLRGEFAAWGRPGVGIVRGRGATSAAIELGVAPGECQSDPLARHASAGRTAVHMARPCAPGQSRRARQPGSRGTRAEARDGAGHRRPGPRPLDRLELFRMLRLLVANGRPLPAAKEVGFEP